MCNYDQILNEQIHTVTAIKVGFFITHWELHLPNDLKTTSRYLVGKADFISRFQQAWTKILMNLNRGTNDNVGKLI